MAAPTADVLAIADAAATHINVAWYEGNVEDFLRQSAQMHKGKVNIIHSSFDPVDIRVRGNREQREAVY